MVVVQAFCLTTVIVVALTLYTFNTKRDLSFMGGTLSTLLLASVIGGFMHVSLKKGNISF
jgi:FtsH-binding integral membrane protein